MLPEDKSRYIEKLQSENKIVAFVRRMESNEQPFAGPCSGIAMGSGTDVAIETSDVQYVNSNFSGLPHALGLAKATYRT